MTHSSPTRRSSDLEHDAIAGRHGAVVGGLGAHDEIGGVVGGQEVAAGGIVPVVAVEKSNPTFRLRQGVGLAGSLVERQGGGGHVGVVVEGCRMLQPAVPPGMVEAAVALQDRKSTRLNYSH